MCFVEIAQLEHKRHNFGINLGAIPLGSRSGAVRGPFGSRACGFRRFVFGENDFGNTIR